MIMGNNEVQLDWTVRFPTTIISASMLECSQTSSSRDGISVKICKGFVEQIQIERKEIRVSISTLALVYIPIYVALVPK